MIFPSGSGIFTGRPGVADALARSRGTNGYSVEIDDQFREKPPPRPAPFEGRAKLLHGLGRHVTPQPF